jgi:predicted transcriptional regulator
MGARETALEEGWLLTELEQRFGYGLEELARRFDRSVSWVSRRLALVELLPETVQQQVRAGAIAAHVAMKYLVPMARANAEDCQRMTAVLATHRYSSREAGQLYAAWRAASPSVRERILAEPQMFLKAQRQVEQRPPAGPAGTPAAELLRDLEMVAAIAHRASRRLAGAAQLMDGRDRDQARRQVDRAIDQLRRLGAKISEEQEHVEPKSTHDDSGTGRPGSQQARDRAGAGREPVIGAPRAARQFGGGARARSWGEGRALPAADPRADAPMQGEPGPGP